VNNLEFELKAHLLLEKLSRVQHMQSKDVPGVKGAYVVSDTEEGPEDCDPRTHKWCPIDQKCIPLKGELQEQIQEDNFVAIDPDDGGGFGKVVEINPEGEEAIVSLISDQNPGKFKAGDRWTGKVDRLIKLSDEDLDDLEPDKNEYKDETDEFDRHLNNHYRELNS